MAVSAPRLGVDHPTVAPTNFRRERDADEAPTDETDGEAVPDSNVDST
jgi:hypothetical protein